MKVLLSLILINTYCLTASASLSSKSLFYSFSNYSSDLYSQSENPSSDYQEGLKKSFKSFIFNLLKKELDLSKIEFDQNTQKFLNNEIKLKAHIKVSVSDIIGENSQSYLSKAGLWIKPYVRDIYFQTNTMVCKYSYRSKFRKPLKSLSDHYIHENHGELYCKDINDGKKVNPYVFGNKTTVFIAGIPSQKDTLVSEKEIFKTNTSKRNLTKY